MRVLVVGGCGLIGFNVAKYYKQQGHDVVVMDNLERSKLLGHEVSLDRVYYNKRELQKLDIPLNVLDISKASNWAIIDSLYGGFDVIFNLAAQCGVPTSIQDPNRDFEINAVGTLNLLEYAREWNSKVVYASTNKVYPIHDGWDLENDRWRWIREDWHKNGFPKQPMDFASRTPYGVSKYTGDMLCQEYHHIYGVETGVFRMSCIYGPNQFGFEEQGWATWFVIATLKNLPIKIYGDGNQVRDMLYVDDLVKAYDAFVQSDVKHGVWNIGGGPNFTLTLNECLDVLESFIGKRSPIGHYNWRPSDQKIYTSDIRDLEKDLNWTPKVSPQEGLKKVTEWVKPIIEIF